MINKDKVVIMFFVLFSTFKIFGQNNFPAELQTEKTDQHSLITESLIRLSLGAKSCLLSLLINTVVFICCPK